MFFIAIVVSDLLFIVSAAKLVSISLPGPYSAVWMLAFVLYLAEIILTLSYDREDSWSNLGLMVVMYFTYCQLWIYIVVKAWWSDYIRKDKRTWAKTERFDVQAGDVSATH